VEADVLSCVPILYRNLYSTLYKSLYKTAFSNPLPFLVFESG
jgi:hypothetical protein